MNQTSDLNKIQSTGEGENERQTVTSKNYPKYYPKPGGTAFIDPKVNPYLLCGLSFGGSRFNDNKDYSNYFLQHGDTSKNKDYSNIIAIKGGYSWDTEDEYFIVAATHSDGYKKYVLEIPSEENVDIALTEAKWLDDKKYTVNLTGLKKTAHI